MCNEIYSSLGPSTCQGGGVTPPIVHLHYMHLSVVSPIYHSFSSFTPSYPSRRRSRPRYYHSLTQPSPSAARSLAPRLLAPLGWLAYLNSSVTPLSVHLEINPIALALLTNFPTFLWFLQVNPVSALVLILPI
jgi:hypothetical protein